MAGKLKPPDIEREPRPGKYPHGDGLYLVVASATSKNWNYQYWKVGKQRWLGLGSLKDVSLKQARLAGDAARLRVKGDRSTPGADIVQEKRAARQEAKEVEGKVTLGRRRNSSSPRACFDAALLPSEANSAVDHYFERHRRRGSFRAQTRGYCSSVSRFTNSFTHPESTRR
jgi:Arm DNA-binding domain